jgi:hypothetical protein
VFIGVQVTTYELGFMDNSITNLFDRSLQYVDVHPLLYKNKCYIQVFQE